MSVARTYPGVYIEELKSTVHTIIGVATSITAFVGRAPRGPVNSPVRVQSFAEYQRSFGGLSPDSPMSFSVQQYFLNGGTDALVVRVVHSNDPLLPANDAAAANVDLNTINANTLSLEASSPGAWGNNLTVTIDHKTRDYDPGELADSLFNLSVNDSSTKETELFRNLSTVPDNRTYVELVLGQQSKFVRVKAQSAVPADRPSDAADVKLQNAVEGTAVLDTDVVGKELDKTGIYALLKADLFNLLCIPPLKFSSDGDLNVATYTEAAKFCSDRRAF